MILFAIAVPFVEYCFFLRRVFPSREKLRDAYNLNPAENSIIEKPNFLLLCIKPLVIEIFPTTKTANKE